MILIWRRWGWLVLPALLLVLGIAEALIQLYRATSGFDFVFNAEKLVLWGAAFLIVAPLVALVDLVLSHVVDRGAVAAGAPRRPRATAFFIPMWAWGIVFAIIGVVFIVANLDDALVDFVEHVRER